MSVFLARTHPVTRLAIAGPNLAGVCLFSLLGLTLSAAVLSCVSSEAFGIFCSAFG